MSEKSGGKATVSPEIREIQEGMAKLKIEAERSTFLEQQKALETLQLKPFPDWPDDRRGAPNTVVRSAVFGVVRRGRRQWVRDVPIAGPQGWSITLSGWRLDQYDCDIWLEVMHLARNQKPGEPVRFTMRSMLRQLGYSTFGKRDYDWLAQRLKHLTQTTIAFENDQAVGVIGNLLQAFQIDHQTSEGVAYANPHIRPLFESVTYFDIEQRRALGANQLAKALHGLLASHAEWLPMRLETVMQRVGAEYARLRDFKRDLKVVLDDFLTRGWIRSYSFIASGSSELLKVSKVATPTQLRAIERRQLALSQ
jgi:hypothetical protein